MSFPLKLASSTKFDVSKLQRIEGSCEVSLPVYQYLIIIMTIFIEDA